MSVTYRAGTWTDVAVLPDGRFVQVTTDNNVVRAFYGDEKAARWEWRASEGLLFCRCATTDAHIVSIHQGQSGTAWLIGYGEPRNLGLTFGVQPVVIDSQFVYIVRSNQSYDRIALATGEVEHLVHGAPGSSQGISDVYLGHVFWADLNRTQVHLPVVLSYPNTRGGVTVGQADPPQIAGFGLALSGGAFTAIEGVAFEPHIAQSGDRYAIVARTPKGAAFVVVPPFQAFVAGAPAPIPVPVPQPKPEAPKPVSIALPASVKSIRDRFVAQFPVPQGPSPADDAFENLCRAWVLHLAETVAALTGSPAWGVKNAGGERPQSKDSLAFLAGGQLVNFDLLSGVGTGRPSLVADPQGEDITGQTFMPVAAINWLAVGPDTLPTGGGPAPQEPAPLPPAPTVPADYERRLKAVEDALSAIEAANSAERAAVAALGEALRLLNEKPAPTYRATGTTSRDYGHSHRINVTLEPIA